MQALRNELKHEWVLYEVIFSEEDLDSPSEVSFENVSFTHHFVHLSERRRYDTIHFKPVFDIIYVKSHHMVLIFLVRNHSQILNSGKISVTFLFSIKCGRAFPVHFVKRYDLQRNPLASNLAGVLR